MKIQVMSDLHIEHSFNRLYRGHVKEVFIPEGNADVLVLAGDIGNNMILFNKDQMPEGRDCWIQELSYRYRMIVMVMGNHDYWDTDMLEYIDKFRDRLHNLGIYNVRILDNDVCQIGDVHFIGGTMWTDFGNNETWQIAAQHEMCDYTYTNRYKDRPLRPADIYRDHLAFKYFVTGAVQHIRGKKVVITHHAPTGQSVNPIYGVRSNSYYFADMSDVMFEDNPPLLWIHGHTHESKDYMCNKTRVICNPRGYDGMAVNRDFNKNLIIEV